MDLRHICVNFLLFCSMAKLFLVKCNCRSFERITDNLREVVIGGCEVFQLKINRDVFCTHGFRNCSEVWERFSTAFLYRPRCDVPEIGYEGYVNLTDHPVPRDMSLFYENVYPFVHRYSRFGQKYYTLSDTLTGYIGNGPYWCSDPNTCGGLAPSGTLCPGLEATPDCPRSATHGFWTMASKRFAEKAIGEMFIMLNASAVPIYASTTYLAMHEMPYLRSGVVTKATILLVNESPTQGRPGMCDDQSLESLSRQMKTKGISYTCVENRRDVSDLLCLQEPTLALCSKPGFIIG